MHVLGIDIGGSGIKGAPVDTASGKMLDERHRIATPQPATPAAVVATVVKVVEHFSWQGRLGCGMPSVVKRGEVFTAANIDPSWIGVHVERMLEEATGCQARALNDADAAALAEMQWGAGAGQSGVVLLITLGTGIGTALFVGRCLLPNTELGHMEIHGREAEQWASDRVRTHKKLNWRAWARRVDEYLLTMERLLWPDLIIIGGGVSKHHDKFLPLLTVKTKVVPAQLRNQAGIVGAALAGRGDG